MSIYVTYVKRRLGVLKYTLFHKMQKSALCVALKVDVKFPTVLHLQRRKQTKVPEEETDQSAL